VGYCDGSIFLTWTGVASLVAAKYSIRQVRAMGLEVLKKMDGDYRYWKGTSKHTPQRRF
jgi:hypothetical protein